MWTPWYVVCICQGGKSATDATAESICDLMCGVFSTPLLRIKRGRNPYVARSSEAARVRKAADAEEDLSTSSG